jgi:hypothetical protein
MASTTALGLPFALLLGGGLLTLAAVVGAGSGADRRRLPPHSSRRGLVPRDQLPRLDRVRRGLIPRLWHLRPRTAAAEIQRQAELAPELERKWDQAVLASVTDPRVRLGELLPRLRHRGFQPRLVYTWRSIATQDRLLQLKRSTVSFSFHNAVDEEGMPRALAADIIDARWGWGDSVHGSTKANGALAFFQALGEEARALGLTWGGDWTRRASFWSRYGMGWDPAHVQGVPNSELPAVREVSVRLMLGRGREVQGSGGYIYRQFGNGYIQVVSGPALVGQLILPKGSPAPWQAITAELARVA